MTMDRHTHRLVAEVLTVLERHGHHARDPEHTGQAVNVIAQLTGIYDGSRDLSASTGRHAAPLPHAESRPEPDSDAVVLTGADISTVLAALDLAAEYKRDHAEVCADCPDESCVACQHRLRDARVYDRLADRIYNGPGPAGRSEPEAGRLDTAPGADPAADKEAGQ
jgi:hypothetical protein